MMKNKSAWDDLKKTKEEEYFRKKEQELVVKIRRRSAMAAQRREMAGVTGIADEEILSTLQELGYTRETVRLLYLVPLIQVAWASGSVTPSEREIVLDAANMIGIRTGSQVHLQLTDWLDERPDQEFFDQTLRVIRDIMETLPPEKRESGSHGLVTFCKNVAAASGGILGFGNKISDDERAVIERIASELERTHQGEAERVITAGS
jgi:hypothetical protein